jgi:hypothetical protein
MAVMSEHSKPSRGAEHRSDKRELGAIGARPAGKSNEPDVRSTTVPA